MNASTHTQLFRSMLRAERPGPAAGAGLRNWSVPAQEGRRARRVSAISAGRIPGRRGGFTLIELLLVLVILGVLAAIVVPKFAGRTEQARVTAAKSQLSTFSTALDAFEVDNGYYPSGKDGLRELVQKPSNAQHWRGPYLQKQEVPLDPWGNAYIYTYPSRNQVNSYDLMSMGPDGRLGGDDDITN